MKRENLLEICLNERVERTAVSSRHELLPRSDILYLFGRGNCIFVREKSENFDKWCLWQPCFACSERSWCVEFLLLVWATSAAVGFLHSLICYLTIPCLLKAAITLTTSFNLFVDSNRLIDEEKLKTHSFVTITISYVNFRFISVPFCFC